MRDVTLGAALEREHREIDENLERFTSGLERGEWDPAPLHAASAALRRHIYLEEEMFFPPLRRTGLVAPVAVMLREHGDIWQALDEVEARAAQRTDPEAVRRAYDDLAYLLDAHNAKEEQILYPQDHTLSDEQTAELRAFMETGTLPEGWICQDLR